MGNNPGRKSSIRIFLPNRTKKKSLTFACKNETPKERTTSRKPTFQNSFRKSLGLKGLKRKSIGVDIIKQISKQDLTWNKKISSFMRHYLLLNFIAVFFTLVIKLVEEFSPKGCGYPPICICEGSAKRMLIAISDISGYWMIWILLICFEVYQKLFRLVIFLMAFLFILFFYIFSDAKGFNWFPIYSFLVLLRLFRYLFLMKNQSVRGMVWLIYRSQGSAFLLIVNYGIFLFLAEKFKLMMEKPWIDIFYSFYFLIFFLFFKNCLIKFGTYAYDFNFENQQQNFLIILAARIAISYFISFMATPFLRFKTNEPAQYLVIFSYSNNLITLYTRFNLFGYVTNRLWRIFSKQKQSENDIDKIDPKSPEKEQKKNIDKIISGCTLDITFISSIRLIIYNLWPGNVMYSNCSSASTDIVGIMVFVSVNILLTLSILIFMAKKGEALFTYRGKLNIYMNIYLLFLTNILFEITLSFFIGKL